MNQTLLLALLCLGVFPCVLSYTLIAPLLPGQLIRRNLDQVYAGIIMGFYTVVSMCAGPFINLHIYPNFGYMAVFATGVITAGTCIILSGACYFITNDTLFIIANILIRIFQGIGMALTFQTSEIIRSLGYTVASIVFKRRFARVLPFLSFANSCGVASGPPLGGALFSILGYPGPFFILGGCVLVYGLLVVPFLGYQFESIIIEGEVKQDQSPVTYKDFLMKRSFICLIGVVVALFITLFYQPILGGKLELQFNFTSDEVAYFYAIFTVSNFIANLLLSLFPLQSGLLCWSSFAAICSIFAAILMGPSQHLGLPNNLTIMGIGTALMGISAQILLISMLILALQPLYEKFPDQIHAISRLFGAYRQVCTGFSFSITPFYSSAITSIFNYQTTCQSVAIVLIIFISFFLAIQLSHRDKSSIHKDLKEPLLKKVN